MEGNDGSIRLREDGRLTILRLGEAEKEHPHQNYIRGFAGDYHYLALRHFVESLIHKTSFETSGIEYLTNLRIQDAVHRSAKENQSMDIP